ncbi:MAG: S-methyl-5-thioribose kinase [Actinomycetaceae bacterium]|nr:S-methyl-5-thioribose kinase [Actinomycetaceae bacterium]
MSQEAEYEFLTVDNIPEYLKAQPSISGVIDLDNIASINEIGDGNMNAVFIVKDSKGSGIILKQALPWVRLSKGEWKMTPKRLGFEADLLQTHGSITPQYVVKTFQYDPERYILAMEDLSDHTVFRTALNNGEIIDGVGHAVGEYCGAAAFETSLFALNRRAYADAVGRTLSPDICAITEDLVFTEPWRDIGRNSYLPENAQDAQDLADDDVMVQEIAYAKYAFMTHTESHIHGDLHTGSVFVKTDESGTKADSVKIFDAEFAFYGPTSFDIGAFVGNLVMASARAYALKEDDRALFLLEEINQAWQGFESAFRARWPQRNEQRLAGDAFLENQLQHWLSEMWLFAAAKMSRRIVGWAKVSDIETLPPQLRVGAARGVLKVARMLVRQRHEDSSPQVCIDRIRAELEANRSS